MAEGNTTAVVECKCEHKAQDEIYGKGKRLHNACRYPGDKADKSGWRCTVCGDVKKADG